MINLKEAYGKQYKIFLDESWEYMENKSEEDKPWYYELKGKYGAIYPYDEKRLAVDVTSSVIAQRVKREMKDQLSLFVDRDDGAVFLFNPGFIHEMAAVIKTKKRKHLSEKHKKKLSVAGEKYRFKHGSKGGYIGSNLNDNLS